MSACNGKAPVSVSNEDKLITWRPALFEHQLHPPFRLVIGRTHQLKTDKPTANVLWPRCAFQRSKDIKFTEKCCWRHQHNLWTKSKKQKINQNFKQINRNAAAFKQTGLHILSATERCYENQHWFGTQDSENWCVTIATVSCRWAFQCWLVMKTNFLSPRVQSTHGHFLFCHHHVCIHIIC